MTDSLYDEELLQDFLTESGESLDSLDSLFIDLESDTENIDIIQSIFRPVHSLKGNSSFFGFMGCNRLAHAMEDVLDAMRQGHKKVTDEGITLLLRGLDFLKSIITTAADTNTETFDDENLTSIIAELKDACEEQINIKDLHKLLCSFKESCVKKLDETQEKELDKIISAAQPSKKEENKAVQKPTETTKEEKNEPDESNNPAEKEKATAQKTMRVREETIDLFLEHTGELLVVGDMYKHISHRISLLPKTRELSLDIRKANDAFNKLSMELQKTIMSIRRVSVQSLLKKAPRLARDIAKATDKNISVKIIGEETLIDKSLISLLDAPLTHIVRNAIDHGLESPDIRTSKGKTEQGTMTIEAKEEGDFFVLSIADDGAGLNLDAIKQKAISIGLIEPNASLTQTDIVELLFSSGVSTAETVSDISGRGVGMDVAKRAIEERGGYIEVDSTKDKGSKFKLFLPKSVTTQIIQAYMFEVEGQLFAVPLDIIEDTFMHSMDLVHDYSDLGLSIKWRDKMIIYRSMNELLSLPESKNIKRQIAITLKAGNDHAAIGVNSVLGAQQVVLRDITGINEGIDYLVGAALLGDGRIALLLDVDTLLEKPV